MSLKLGILSSLFVVVLCRSSSADDRMVISKPMTPLCAKLLREVISKRSLYPIDRGVELKPEDASKIRDNAKRIVLQEIAQMEDALIQLRLRRDDLLNKLQTNGGSARRDEKFNAEFNAIEVAIKESIKPENLHIYRKRMGSLKQLLRELEEANLSIIGEAPHQSARQAIVTQETRPPRPRPLETSVFRPGFVFRASVLASVILGTFSFGVVPGTIQGVKSLAKYAERHPDSFIGDRLGASKDIPSFEEVINWSYKNLYSPAADWSWQQYGEPAWYQAQDWLNKAED